MGLHARECNVLQKVKEFRYATSVVKVDVEENLQYIPEYCIYYKIYNMNKYNIDTMFSSKVQTEINTITKQLCLNGTDLLQTISQYSMSLY